MHVTINFGTLQYSGELSFLSTANEIEPCVTGHMRAQWNFRGVKLLGALEKSGLITNINIIVLGENLFICIKTFVSSERLMEDKERETSH